MKEDLKIILLKIANRSNITDGGLENFTETQ